MSTVLLVGEDELLQQTRAAVLRTIGADVICSNPDSVFRIQQDRECDLIVLCHSLPDHLAATIAENIRFRWPETRILLMTSSRIWEATDTIPAVDAISSADPERLVLRTVELLGRKPPRGATRLNPATGQISA